MTVGELFGVIFFGWLSDTKGRIYTMRIVGIIGCCSCAIMATANNYYVVLIAYVFIGILYCSDNVNTTTVLTDFTPLSKRWIIPLLGMAWTIGSTIVSLFILILSMYDLSAIMVYRLF